MPPHVAQFGAQIVPVAAQGELVGNADGGYDSDFAAACCDGFHGRQSRVVVEGVQVAAVICVAPQECPQLELAGDALAGVDDVPDDQEGEEVVEDNGVG